MAVPDSWLFYGLLLDTASGFLFMGLAAFVLSVKPRTRLTLGFGLFALNFGVNLASVNLEALGYISTPTWLSPLAWATVGAMAVALALEFPRRYRGGLRPLLPALALPLAVVLVWVAIELELLRLGIPTALTNLIWGWGYGLGNVGWVLFLSILAVRFPLAAEPTERRQLALASGALLIWFAFRMGMDGWWVLAFWDPWLVASLGLYLAAPLAIGGLWVRATMLVPPGDRAPARRVALLAFLMPLPGLVLASLYQWDAINLGFLGLARTVGVAVFGYAILKYQLLDIDVRVKWGIRQSTVAAVFVAAFFIVSELAQEIFSDSIGPIAGIAAAGALVFALAPLQRAAERVADKAMPNVVSVDGTIPLRRRREVYRSALSLAWDDGVLSPADVSHLHELRDILGLPREEIDAMEREFLERARAP